MICLAGDVEENWLHVEGTESNSRARSGPRSFLWLFMMYIPSIPESTGVDSRVVQQETKDCLVQVIQPRMTQYERRAVT